MVGMVTVRVHRSEFGPITLKTRTYSAALNFLNKLDSFGVLAPDKHDPAEPTPIYFWIDGWFANATPFAEITGEPE
jgi:hypothetical protein